MENQRLLTIETCAECFHAQGLFGVFVMSLEAAKEYTRVSGRETKPRCGKTKTLITTVDPFEAIPDDCPLPKVKG